MGVDAGDAEGELVHVQLAQEDGAGGLEPDRRLRVLLRHALGHDLGAGGGADAGGIEQVLEGDGYAVKGPLIVAAGDGGGGLLGGGERILTGNRDERA